MTAAPAPPAFIQTRFAAALARLPVGLDEQVLQHWQAFLAALPPRATDWLTDAALLDPLARVWATSEFVAGACSRNPALLEDLWHSGDLATAYPAGHYPERLDRQLGDSGDEAGLQVELRRFRTREMVRIAWRDLAGLAPLAETLQELSRLADALIDAGLAKLYAWQCQRFGVPRNAGGEPQRMVVLGMGKLGGNELNFSSDIDLIFAFPQPGQTDGARPIANEEFFRRLGQRLINLLQENTAEGFVYRVDMRLRPFGESGPLTMPFSAFEDYYQSHGREWERYALIKARAVAGDAAAGAQLLASLQPFVYRRYLDYGAFESLRAMQALIAKEVERKGLKGNIKLGPGGIREIEFIAQAFQLIYGGREPALRERSVSKVLDALALHRRLPGQAVAALKQAYDFLRRTENRLQAWADQQTHSLPSEPRAQLRLAFAMGCTDWGNFAAALRTHTEAVTAQFRLLFAAAQSEAAAAAETDLAAVWRGALGEDAAHDCLRRWGFADPQRALASLERLRASFSFRALSAQGRERMHQLMPLVLHAVAANSDPTQTLERVVRLLEAIARRSVYLALLIENSVALAQLVKLCAASTWISDYLARFPLLLDDLLEPSTLYRPLNRTQLEAELDLALARLAPGDEEQRLDALRHFKNSHVLRVAAADVSGAMPLMIVSDHLTEIAEVLLRRILALAWDDLRARHGEPRYVLDGTSVAPRLAIVAYGKLGGIELGYGSDLDLVFLHDSAGDQQQTNGVRTIDNASWFAKLAQRIIHMLSAHTAAGVLYEVDTRLRPSGRSGLLVSSFTAFADYQHHHAWTWEHQALIRARVVAGPEHLAQRFNELRRVVLAQPRAIADLRRAVREMRERMRTELGSAEPGVFDLKQDRGGIADIEFIVQYSVLANAHRHPELLTYTDNIRQLDALERARLLTPDEANLLRDAYRTLRRRAHHLRLQGESESLAANALAGEREDIVRLWRQLLESDRPEFR